MRCSPAISFAGVRAVVAETIARIKAVKPSLLVCVDPILGDAGRLYVAQETAEAIRDQLIPLAEWRRPICSS